MASSGPRSPGTAAGRARMHASVRATAAPGLVRYDVAVRGCPALGTGEPCFFVEVSGDVVPPPVDRHDFVVQSLLFAAMRTGADLHVEGRLSHQLLVNLEEFQRAWAAWLPHRYRPVRISCDEEVPPERPDARPRAVLAFSGGVDSTFAMVDQLEPSGARDRWPLAAAVLIHGFDVGLDAAQGFAAALADARAATGSVGVPLSVVRTDMRAALSWEWPDEFGAAVVACLAVFAPVAGVGILASDHDYRCVVLPWGSNAITNPMLSSDVFRVETVGAAVSRTARVAKIAAHGPVADRVRVCWAGNVPGRNCGVCEKCVRTKLNFMAVGAPVPASLAPPPRFGEIVGLVARDRQKLDFLVDIRQSSRGASLSRGTRLAVELMVWKNRALLPLRGWRRVLRGLGRRLTGRPPRLR